MDPETVSDASAPEDRRNLQVDNALRAIRDKKPLPEIDFTIHTMEDGTQVSTQERVCKGAWRGIYVEMWMHLGIGLGV
jgi:serine/threonine-protein phosphatase 2B catalytic subunit